MEGETELVEQFETKEEAQKTVKEALQAKKKNSNEKIYETIAAIFIFAGLFLGIFLIANSWNQPEPILGGSEDETAGRTPVLAVYVSEDLIRCTINLVDPNSLGSMPSRETSDKYSRKNGPTPGLIEMVKPVVERFRANGGKVDHAVFAIKLVKEDNMQGIHFDHLYHENWKDIDIETLKKELGISNIVLYNRLTDSLAAQCRKILGGTK